MKWMNETQGNFEVMDAKSVVQGTLVLSSCIKRSDSGMYACSSSSLMGNAKPVKIYVWCKLHKTKCMNEVESV